MKKDKFVCPRCGKEYHIEDAVELEQTTSYKIGMPRLVGRKIVSTDYVQFANVKFCPKCAKKQKFSDKWGFTISLFITIILTILIEVYVIHSNNPSTPWKNTIISSIVLTPVFFIPILLVTGFINTIIFGYKKK